MRKDFKMILCKTEQEISNQFDAIGVVFEWKTPLELDCMEEWEDGIPKVSEKCPNCNQITDRVFNQTDKIHGIVWYLEKCDACDSVWFHCTNYRD